MEFEKGRLDAYMFISGDIYIVECLGLKGGECKLGLELPVHLEVIFKMDSELFFKYSYRLGEL